MGHTRTRTAAIFILAFLFAPNALSFERCLRFEDMSTETEFIAGDSEFVACYKILDDVEMAYIKEGTFADPFAATMVKDGKLHFLSKNAGEAQLVTQSLEDVSPLPFPPTFDEALSSPRLKGESLSFTEVNEDNLFALKTRLSGAPDIDLTQERSFLLDDQAYISADRQPTAGYWWPHIGIPMAKDQYAPMPKFDRYATAVTGYNPRTAEWERAYHSSNVDWAGHCNGWVSSSILEKYEDIGGVEPQSGVEFSSSDVQGLRSASHYCTRNNFYGQRYGSTNQDVNDIYPDQFHRLLVYYIRDLQKPLAFDYRVRTSVDNHIISGYRFVMEQTATPNRYLVQAILRAHAYKMDDYVHSREIAHTYEKTYWYYMYFDGNGNPYGGEWVNPEDHPDFVWSPVSQSRCGNENPRLDAELVERLVRSLRQAKK